MKRNLQCHYLSLANEMLLWYKFRIYIIGQIWTSLTNMCYLDSLLKALIPNSRLKMKNNQTDIYDF